MHTQHNNTKHSAPHKYSDKIREEELKNKVAEDFFDYYDTTQIIGNIDFCVALRQKQQHSLFEHTFLLWAEAKKGYKYDLYEALVQLVLTIGKSKIYERFLPPPLLGAFNAAQIVFLPYNTVMEVFSLNDFNWNVTPSNHDTKEFQQLYNLIQSTIEKNLTVFDFKDHNTLKLFIHNNFKITQQNIHKIQITKNNFISVYFDWRVHVQPSIGIDWELAKNAGILDADFYLADLLSANNLTLKDKLYVLLKTDHYEFDRKLDELSLLNTRSAFFNDQQKAHTQFWNIYERPPRKEFWYFIIDRRDQLVPQDIRERKGSFYTPRQWVELSQQYIADVLGDDWQEEYYVWDCAAGTGNLLVGLHNKYNIWASTLDQADVDIMKDRIVNGANLLESHVFQFDFLNDDLQKVPEDLQDVINDPEKRKKLIIYINPPYAEATNIKKVVDKNNQHKNGVSNQHKTYLQYKQYVGRGINEIAVQFLLRAYFEIKNSYICHFSKIKMLQGDNFKLFRKNFQAELKKLFLVPSYTFDNVKGQFPIGFFIWKIDKQSIFKEIIADVYNTDCILIENKKIQHPNAIIMQWLQKYYDKNGQRLAYLVRGASDFHGNKMVYITCHPSQVVVDHSQTNNITQNNLREMCIYFAVRHVIRATWLNDRDQFLYPNNLWQNDHEFHTDCLTFTLFNNNVLSDHGKNDWIPFTEAEVHSQSNFKSHFMTDYMTGKIYKHIIKQNQILEIQHTSLPQTALQFSSEAQAVFNAGCELYTYYHAQKNINVNASLYEIKEYFQGRNDKGKLKTTSEDEKYNKLYNTLKQVLKILADKIVPKVYEYGFLKQ